MGHSILPSAISKHPFHGWVSLHPVQWRSGQYIRGYVFKIILSSTWQPVHFALVPNIRQVHIVQNIKM